MKCADCYHEFIQHKTENLSIYEMSAISCWCCFRGAYRKSQINKLTYNNGL
jgi:hypothetical protein